MLKNCLYTEKGSGRGRRRLDDSLDEEKHSVLPLATRSIPVLSSESSLSESETVGEEEGEGLKRDSKEDKLSCLNDRSTRSLGKTKGELMRYPSRETWSVFQGTIACFVVVYPLFILQNIDIHSKNFLFL